jgi:anti-anti-sigma regulatory factor
MLMDREGETRIAMQDNAGLRVRTETDGCGRIVHVEGELSLTDAGTLREALMEGLRPGVKTALDASRIAAVDLSGLQLICSACRTYSAHGAMLELDGVSGALREGARSAGYNGCEPTWCGVSACLLNW